MITLRNHELRSNMTLLPVTLSVVHMIILFLIFENSLYAFGQLNV